MKSNISLIVFIYITLITLSIAASWRFERGPSLLRKNSLRNENPLGVFRIGDFDNDNKLSLDEYKELYQHLSDPEALERFNELDLDNNNFLEGNEVHSEYSGFGETK